MCTVPTMSHRYSPSSVCRSCVESSSLRVPPASFTSRGSGAPLCGWVRCALVVWGPMPLVEIEWVSKGTVEQDEAMVDKIAALVHALLEDQDPAVSATLVSQNPRIRR